MGLSWLAEGSRVFLVLNLSLPGNNQFNIGFAQVFEEFCVLEKFFKRLCFHPVKVMEFFIRVLLAVLALQTGLT